MALTQKFNRRCTNYYYYSNSFTCNDKQCNQTNSGYSNHTDYDDYYSNCSDSGYSDRSHSESYYSDGCPQAGSCSNTISGCNNHSESSCYQSDHSDYGCSDYSNYTNYQNGYYCSTYTNYTNYIDASNARLGGPISLTWSHSIDTNAKISSNAIKEIRDNVRRLSTEKQRNQVNDTNVSTDSGNASDSLVGPYKRILSSSVTGIRDVLNSLYSELGQSNSNNPSFSNLTNLTNATISSLKTAINTLATKDLSGSYVNYVNSSYDYNNQNTYSNSSNIPTSQITYYGNAGSYTNSYCSEYRNS